MSLYHVEHPKPEFPKMKYAPSGGAVMVANATEERALGPFWTDMPPAPVAAAIPEIEEEEPEPEPIVLEPVVVVKRGRR
jgi:hypothetical protein